MAHQRPLIGITCRSLSLDYTKLLGKVIPCSGNTDAYHEVLDTFGAIPVLLPPVSVETVGPLLARLDGVLFTGGEDIDPQRYGMERHETVTVVDTRRDEFEFMLLSRARELDLPLLGVCRGCQLINVGFGGTLLQHVEGHRAHNDPEVLTRLTQKAVVHSGSQLASILNQDTIAINSIHHQAIERLGNGLRVAAVAEDGTVEAVELACRGQWVVGVQWHPELIPSEQSSQAIFSTFISEANKVRGARM
jgi:putative glutamine amidotransferase